MGSEKSNTKTYITFGDMHQFFFPSFYLPNTILNAIMGYIIDKKNSKIFKHLIDSINKQHSKNLCLHGELKFWWQKQKKISKIYRILVITRAMP